MLFFFYETKINLQSHEGRRRVYRRRGGRNSAVCIEEMDKFSGGKNIMIWARVSMHTKTKSLFVSSLVLQQEGTRMTFSGQFLSLISWLTET